MELILDYNSFQFNKNSIQIQVLYTTLCRY